MLWLKIVTFIVWLYVVYALHRAELFFFKFLVGSVGMFFFLMMFIQPIILHPLSMAVTAVTGIPGDLFGFYDSYYRHVTLFIPKDTISVSMIIDYECSGIVEIMAFSSLLWFYPLYNNLEKLVIDTVGIALIFLVNVLRLFLIAVLIYYYGNEVFYFAHTLFGRVIFYIFSITLYFYVFTRPHIIRQKVGVFKYGNIDNIEPDR
jgi:exosortase family protein XrtG